MGTTILYHQEADEADGLVESYFKSKGGGATNWGALVDAYKEDVEAVGALLSMPPQFHDGALSMGRGASVLATRAQTAVARWVWHRRESVRRAIKRGELTILDGVGLSVLVETVGTKHASKLKALIEDNRAEEAAGEE